MITVSHLCKEYSSVTPLTDVNAEIHAGEIISVIGPSGTGKSTLLRCLNGLEKPTSGSICVNGVTITDKGCRISDVRKKMGMVFQSFNLFEHMNVLENITYAPRKLLGLSREDAEAEAKELLSMVSLSGRERAYPDELSGGQKQRVAIARTLAMHPEIILFDEPTSALDPTMVGEVLSVIRMLAQKGMTMMIVTHEMKFARDVSTRVFYMDQGIIYEDGTPEQIFDNPQKELTRRFVRKVKVLEKEMICSQFDFLSFSTELDQFGRKNMLGQRTIYNAQVVLEELCVLTLLKQEPSARFVLEFSEKDSKAEIHLYYGQKPFNPVENMDRISKTLVENAVNEVSHCFEGNENHLVLTLKN